MSYIRKLLPLLKPYWLISVIALLLLIGAIAMELTIPRLIQRIIDLGITENDMQVVLQTSLMMIGITLVNIELKKTNVPEPVQPSFNEVNQAVQEKEKMIYQAKEAYNKAIPAAKGDAEKVIKSAEGYAMDRINRSEGDASRFLVLWEEYTKSKNVTRRRLYLESMREVIPKLGKKYIIDPEQKGILPLLNLDIKGER